MCKNSYNLPDNPIMITILQMRELGTEKESNICDAPKLVRSNANI